ncbi:MAG: hypothetical protein V2J24_01305, partial [Pseudomonadales bacterium]|nr:hypothetical protein [Pseudomonadales bacterium]
WYRESIIGCMFDRNTSPPSGAPGVWRLECPANQGAAIFADDVALLKLEDVDEYEFMASIRLAAVGSVQVRAGYTTSNGSNSEPSSGIYFSLDGSGNWQGECRDASTSTLVTSAVSAVGIASLRFNYDASVPDVEFFVNGTSIGTCTTNLPAATTAGWPVKIQMVDSGNTFPWIDIDGAGYTLRWDTEAR